MKKALVLMAVISLLLLQSALAYEFDVHRTYDHYNVHRQTTGTFGEGHHMESSWGHNGEHSATVVRDVDWSHNGDCWTRDAHTSFDFENYQDRSRHRTTSYGCC